MSDNALTELELVRLNITDLDQDKQLFTDAQIKGWLQYHGGSVPRASAKALRVMAASEVLVSKVISTQDLRTDGRAVSKELRELAAEYDEEAEREDLLEEDYMALINFGGRTRSEGEEVLW